MRGLSALRVQAGHPPASLGLPLWAGGLWEGALARQSLGSLVALVFGVVVSVLLPRVLGAEVRGEYQLSVKLAGLVLAVAQWGIPEVLLQMMADGRARSGTLIGTSLLLGLIGAVLLAAILGL